MISQLRVYTINRGKMDAWLKFYMENIVPIYQKLEIPIEATWVNADRTEFVWVRSFDSVEDLERKEKAYYATEERKALGNTPLDYIAKIEIKLIEPVLQEEAPLNPRRS